MKKIEKKSHWYYNGKIYDPSLEEMLESGNIGFVYVIVNDLNKKKYIGKKLCITTKKMPPLKGRKNKRHKKAFTDWKTYTGSSKYLNEDIEYIGPDFFTFHILTFHPNKTELNYAELSCQVHLQVLESRNDERLYYNENIGQKFYHSEVFNEERIMNNEYYKTLII